MNCAFTNFATAGSDGRIETSRKACKDKINYIERWTDAFIIYSSIYHYMYNVREYAARQDGGPMMNSLSLAGYNALIMVSY